MSKNIDKNNNNLITHDNGFDKLNDSSFTMKKEEMDIKEFYWNLLKIIKELDTIISSTFNNTYLLTSAKNLIDNNNVLSKDFEEKSNNSIEINNELNRIFEDKLVQISDIYNNNIKIIDDETKTDTRAVIDELLKFQQDAIARYKLVENSFMPKTKFLSNNKKVNKEEYIKIITDINQQRIASNQTYNNIANDLSNKNEQQQYQFKHSLDASIEKNTYDIAIISEEAEEQIKELNLIFDSEEKNKTQAINIKHRSIIDNTIELNETITDITNNFQEKLLNELIPFNEKNEKFYEEININDKTYKLLEEKVLDEFKTLLQQNDNEIETLRQNHRDFEEEYKKNRKQIKKDFNLTIKKEISIFNQKIEAANNRYQETSSIHDKEVLDKLEKDKKEYIKKANKGHQENIKKIDKEYYEHQLSYIENIEKIRAKKSHCEAIKSSAVKNINYEKSYNFERLNAEIAFNAFEKENYTTLDHFEENKEIYQKRLKYDKLNEGIRFEINEIDLDIYQDNIEHKHEINKIITTKEYNISLSNADLDYQRKVIENRKNFHNVKTMLDIQRQHIINKYDILLINEKMDFEQKKSLFYNNCDNLQYELFKNENELKYKLIDEEINLNQELAEVKKQHIAALANYKKRILQNKKSYAENLEHIKVYEERLAVEKNMFYNTYEHFKNSLLNLIDFENYVFSLCISLPSYYFENYKKQLLLILEYTKKMKIYNLDEYHKNMIDIIKSRIDFEKEIKYKKILENLSKEWNELETFSKTKVNKLNSTINSYQNTVKTSKDALHKTKNQLRNSNDSDEIERLEKQILLLNKQIKVNKNNIFKQNNIRKEQINKIISAEKKFKAEYEKIEKSHMDEAKIYNDIIDSINHQNNKLKANLVKNTGHLSFPKQNKDLEGNIQKSKATNNLLLILSKNYFDINYSILSNSITKQYNSLKQTGENSNIRFNNEIEKLLEMEDREFTTSNQTIINNYKSLIEAIEKDLLLKKEKILNNLKQTNVKHKTNIISFENKIKTIEEKKNCELRCHKDNFDMYQEKYNKKNNEIINKYLLKIENIKKDYKNKVNLLELKLKVNHKHIKSQHLSNETLYKNNITSMDIEYKEYIKGSINKIKELENVAKEEKSKHENEISKYYELYLANQKDTRKEFETQSKIIDNKCAIRINNQKRDFKKKFNEK